MNPYSYCPDKEEGVNLLKDLLSKLYNIHEENGNKFYFGSNLGILPNGENGTEIECNENLEIIKQYIPNLKQVFKGNSNWCNMMKRDKKVASHIRFLCKCLTGENLKKKTCRYDKFKSININKFYLPNL